MNDLRMEKLQAAMQDKQYVKELMALENVEDIQAKFLEAGIEFTSDEVQELVNQVVANADAAKTDELGEAVLDGVTGGSLVGMAIFVGLTALGVGIGWKAAGGCNGKKQK